MLFLRVLQMCMWRHPQNAPLPYKGYRWVLCSKAKYISLKESACGSLFSTSLIFLLILCRDEDWEDNDGALNTISMTHPRIPTEHPHRFVVDDSDCHPLQPGIWLVLRFRVLPQFLSCLVEIGIFLASKYF
jgi:hypothetical protein